MRILTTGRGKSGSWIIRGEQLGSQVGSVNPRASLADIQGADVVVVTKRLGPYVDSIRAAGRKWIWDLIDFYPQPECGIWTREQAIRWVRGQIQAVAPTGVIYANQRMQMDIALPGIWIPHHCRPDTLINPVRERVQVVGYEGSEKYLGRWRPVLEAECTRRGWKFACNDRPVGDMDIVVAFRDSAFNGYCQRAWKSNVKLANAHGAGTPFVGPQEEGYLETATGFECWVDQPKQLAEAFDQLESHETRFQISQAFRRARISVESCAMTLRDYAEALFHYR